MRVLSFICFGLLVVGAWGLKAAVSTLSSGGLRFAIDDVPGATLAAVHYSVNSPLAGTQPGRWNFDIRSKSGNTWVHENPRVRANPGDTVYYWVYVIINGLGRSETGLSWKVPNGSGSSQPSDKPSTSGGSSSGGSSSGDGSSGSSQSTGSNRLAGKKLRLVLEDDFNGASLDKSKWNQDVTLWGGGNWEFQAYTPLTDNTYTKDGKLYIKPTLTADKYGENFLKTGRWDMKAMYGSCTQSSSAGCVRDGKHGLLNPIMSGRLTSKATITYGKVEIVAKLPRGDWIWPALWMYPKSHTYGGWPRSGEIDIMESRGNRNFGHLGVNHMGTTLHWGTQHVNKYQLTSKGTDAKHGTFADGLHKYTFDWDQTGMDFYLDDEKIVTFNTPQQGFFRWGNLPGNNIWNAPNAPFNHPFYLIINVAVGGTNGFFPDGISNGGYSKPWNNKDSDGPQKFWNAKNKWYPTWKGDDAAMQIESVKIWQLE